MRPVFILCLLAILPAPAFSGAWLLDVGDSKILAGRTHETKPDQFIINQFTRIPISVEQTTRSIYLEHGLSKNWTLIGKSSDTVSLTGNAKNTYRLSYGGAMTRLKFLEFGLLPPYFVDLVKVALPHIDIKRDKRASLALALANRRTRENTHRTSANGHNVEIALADKVSFGRVSLTQMAEFGQLRLNGTDWQSRLYRFEIGFGANWRVSTEAQFFHDTRQNFDALGHYEAISWRWPGYGITLKLLQGTKRETGNLKSDVRMVEIEWAF